MKLAVLFSGGKDSTLALAKALETDEVVCLVTLFSENAESYMFHTPNIHLARLQAERIGLPVVEQPTKGEKEEELKDLEIALLRARADYGAEGVVTGAIASVYQASRVQRVCDAVDMWCFNPLWQRDQQGVVDEVIASGFEVVISGVFAEPFDETWLGRRFDAKLSDELKSLAYKHLVSPSGEGGEIETTVLNAPFFSSPITIKKSSVNFKGHAGTLRIEEAQ